LLSLNRNVPGQEWTLRRVSARTLDPKQVLKLEFSLNKAVEEGSRALDFLVLLAGLSKAGAQIDPNAILPQ
jgi:hypothetical protein